MESPTRLLVALLAVLCALAVWADDAAAGPRDAVQQQPVREPDAVAPPESQREVSGDAQSGAQSGAQVPDVGEGVGDVMELHRAILSAGASDPELAVPDDGAADAATDAAADEGDAGAPYVADDVLAGDDTQIAGEPDTLDALVAGGESLITWHHNATAALAYFRLAGLLGHSGAMSTAGTMLLSGDLNLTRDIDLGVRYLRLAASHGQPDAQSMLGMLHASGLADRYGVEKSSAKALLYWKFAAEAGNVYAATALGFRYMHGIDVPASCETAAQYYKNAASAVATDPRNWPTVKNFMQGKPPLPSGLVKVGRLRLTEENIDRDQPPVVGDEDRLHFIRHSAARGNRDAQATLGALQLFGGNGLHPNEAHARVDLRQAADHGHGEAHGILGHMAMRNQENSSAIIHFRMSAATQDRIGHYALGMIFLHGIMSHERDLSKAAMHFQLAAENSTPHAEAIFQLGLMAWNGKGMKKSPEDAFRYFEKGARLGNMQSKLNLGIMLLDGTYPVPQPSCKLALPWLKEVAEDGEWRTLFDMAAESFFSGDRYGALYRYIQAAHAGIELAQFNAGLLLEKHMLNDIDEIAHWPRERVLSEAYEMYDFSARQDQNESSNSLVRMGDLSFGEGKDFQRAASSYKRAILLRSAEAMFNLGWMHVRGFGVPQDRRLAVRYFDQAKESGDLDAVIPVNLALVALRLYWWASDLKSWLASDVAETRLGSNNVASNSAGMEQPVDLHVSGGSNAESPAALSASHSTEDLAFVAALLFVLCLVLLVRRKRINAQQHAHSS